MAREADKADPPPERNDVPAMHAPLLREQADPRDGAEPISRWLAVAFAGVLVWGGWYLLAYSGGFRANQLSARPGEAGASPPAVALTPMERGRLLYNANCAVCHMTGGTGQAGAIPPLAGSEWVNDSSPAGVARVKRIVLCGLQGEIAVGGNPYNNNMPAWGPLLTDADVANVLTFVRSSWGNRASVLTSDNVAATRAATAGRHAVMDASELRGVAADDATPSTKP